MDDAIHSALAGWNDFYLITGTAAAALTGLQFVVQTLIAFPVPSSSGRAVLTLPILVPLSDLLGLSRQVTVLAYQYGPGIVGQFSPTDGPLMAILALAGVSYERWLRFCVPICAALFLMSLAAVVIAAMIGLR